ncbi:AI-2E family transporter [Virgisporangium ochraceum]|uniref:AI-2E family transporter n=1 Tax=Virgisporangium ochraceum TaxID=65505 RepID=A0A8J4EJR7_9ACTN|nr:AI-2E family transporter [Virgisporangium ochraceum]GIJ74607.1 AI-2E family transporter [Virgisporangium ochraceum]
MGRLQRVGSGFRRFYSATRATMREREREASVEALGGPEIIAKQAVESPQSGNGVRADPPIATAPSVSSRDDSEVSKELRIAAAYAWRLIILAVALAGVLYLVGRLSHVVIPLAIALLLSALLGPLVRFLRVKAKFPPSLAAGLVLVAGLAAVIGTLTLVVTQIVDKFDVLSRNATVGATRVRDWLQDGPLKLETRQIDNAIETAQNWLTENQGRFVSTAQSTATATIEALAAFFLVLFATFFFMRDGDRIWRFLVRIFPRRAEEQVHDAGVAAWATLGAYVRATVLVAFIDALGIGIGLYFLKVTLWFPLAALVFLFAFVPIVGATLSGAVAVLVTLVERGPWQALIALIIVIAVQQLEGHVLQPLIMGRAVAIHPLAVIVGIAAGVVLAGIMGALVAVPIIAVLNTAVRFLVLKRKEAPPDSVVVASEAP